MGIVLRPVSISRQLLTIAEDVICFYDPPVKRGELFYMPPHDVVYETWRFVKGADTDTIGAIRSDSGPELKTPFIVAVPFQGTGLV